MHAPTTVDPGARADAEEAAAERDRLKAKLAKLKEEHKRKMMIKILSRMSNMTYYQAWSAWYNGTIKINQLSADEELKMLLREVAAAKEQAEKLEAEAQARADEAAAWPWAPRPINKGTSARRSSRG